MATALLTAILIVVLGGPGAAHDEGDGDDGHRVAFTFVWVNGQLVPVAQPTTGATDEEGGLSSAILQAIFLVLLFALAFSGGSLLVATVWSSITLNRLPFNLLLMNLGAATVIECLANMGMSLAYVVSRPWRFGTVVCHINAYLMEVVPVLYTLLLLGIAFDRVWTFSI